MKTMIFFLCIFFLVNCGEQSPAEVESRIANSEVLTRVDKLCNDLPKPKDFQFVRKSISGNSFTSSISYSYKSSTPYREAREFHNKYLFANGWIIGDSAYYEKGNKQISLSTVDFPGAKYSLYCAEVEK